MKLANAFTLSLKTTFYILFSNFYNSLAPTMLPVKVEKNLQKPNYSVLNNNIK